MENWNNKNRNNNFNNKNRGNFSKQDNVQKQPNEPIKSPYNFVPLSDKVVFPDWAKDVSHDIPFGDGIEDGISGKIELKVILQSDTYIRNGGKWDEKTKNDNPDYQKFFTAKVNGEDKYIIPGTSFKGMIRNVLEIATFGKMQRFNDDRYSIRDLRNRDYTNRLVNKVKAGWLHKDGNNNWMIYPCSYGRVEQEDLERIFKRKIGREDKESAEKKYKEDLGIAANYKVWILPADVENARVLRISKNQENNLTEAVLVLTGQPSKRQDFDKLFGRIPKRKHLEFVFYDKQKQPLDVSKLKDNFEFINKDSNGFELEAWGFWKNQLKEGKDIPVFYLEKNGKVESFGLAMMYRLPYDYSVKNAVKPQDRHSSEKPDFSDLIFGYVNGKDALRGRVRFSHFVSKESVKKIGTAGLKTTVLGSPKATYYPNYLEQPNLKAGYKLFWDKDAKISGWKRYPAQGIKEISYPEPASENVKTNFIPLKAGEVFTGSMRFFNLKPEELGALIWSLKFGRFDDEGKYFQHNIGMGKPLGCGRITIDITENINSETLQEIDLQDCVAKFQSFMEDEFKNEIYSWEKSPQIKELRKMADVRFWKDDQTTSCPSLEKKEFEAAKGNKYIESVKLERYSDIVKYEKPREVEIIEKD